MQLTQNSWIPVVAGAASALIVLTVGAYASPATQLVATQTSFKPAVAAGATLPQNNARLSKFQVPSTALQAQEQSAFVSNSNAQAPTNSAGWMAIGAGLSCLMLAVFKSLQQTKGADLQSVTVPQMAMVAASGAKSPPANLKLHVYDHCPYCTRVELFLGWNGIKYQRVLYGYGDMEGPKFLTGKKQLPVLEGDGVWTPAGMKGLPESLDIIAWTAQEWGLVIPPTTGRKDVDDWQKRAKAPIASLSRPRMIKMPYRDFQKPEDIEYAFGKWAKKTGFVPEEALAATPALLAEMEVLLKELEGLLRGEASLNAWGLGMDDIILLPDLRRLTCVKGLKWPPKVKNYLDKALGFPAMQCVSYEPYAF